MKNAKVINLNSGQKQIANCNLQAYNNQQFMDCPVTQRRLCYFIPLDHIDGFQHNPGRSGGTQPTAVSQLIDDLIMEPKGQLEPICLEWNPATGKFEIVFGCHREWAVSDAYNKAFAIANHPSDAGPGIWAWIFTGSASERTKTQMRENGNKKPQSPATKDEMVDMLGRYITQGGLDTGYPTAYTSLTDDEKYNRAKDFMKSNTPYWGGRKFLGIWNKLTQNGNSAVNLSFTTFSKEKVITYFCAHNPYGIRFSDLKKGGSGSIVTKNKTKYAIYFVNAKTEIAGALPTNASKCRYNNKVQHMIIVAALNDSTTANIAKHRTDFENNAKDWNKIYKAFDEVFWMPQTKSETQTLLLAGKWVAKNTV